MALTSIMITKASVGTLAFTTPIADSMHFYVKRRDDASIKEIKDLAGKKVGV